MATLEKDTLKRPPTGVKAPDGFRDVRYHWVSGLTGPLARRTFEALTTSGVEYVYDAHPYIPGLLVASVEFTVDKDIPSAGLITVSYRDASWSIFNQAAEPSDTGDPQIKIDTRLVPVRTELDIHGEQIHTLHRQVVEDPSYYNPVGAKRQNGIADVMMPVTMVQYTRREPSSPGSKALKYVGTISKTRTFGDPPRWWLCTGISGDSSDGGASYVVSYEFQRTARYNFEGMPDKLKTWDYVLVQYDETTNLPVDDPVLDEGITAWQMYRETEFRDMHVAADG